MDLVIGQGLRVYGPSRTLRSDGFLDPLFGGAFSLRVAVPIANLALHSGKNFELLPQMFGSESVVNIGWPVIPALQGSDQTPLSPAPSTRERRELPSPVSVGRFAVDGRLLHLGCVHVVRPNHSEVLPQTNSLRGIFDFF